jgi:hypothetical protein
MVKYASLAELAVSRVPDKTGKGDLPMATNPDNPKEQLLVLMEHVPPLSHFMPSVQQIVNVLTNCA